MKFEIGSLGIFQKDFVVGLDLGSSSVKMAQLAPRKEGLALIKAGLKEIADPDDPALREKEISSALKDLLQGVEIRKSEFVISFNGPEVGMRVLTVPPMPKEELMAGIKLEAKNYFPFPLENSVIDVEPYGEVMEKGVKKQRVAVAAAPRKAVSEILDILKKIGIRPVALVPIPWAFQKLIAASDLREGKTLSWVDIGARQTELVIFKGRDLVFSRKIPVAGIDFSRAMTGVLVSDRGRTELSLEEAEKIKREVGMPAEEVRVIQDKISAPQILSLLRSPLERLTSEIERCFDYYREETGGETVDSVVLFGRGALLKGLAPFLSEGLGIEVKVGNPLEGLKIEAQIVIPDQGVAPLTAALGAAFSFGKGLNLLPSEIKEEIQRAFKRVVVQSLAAGLILILAFLYIGMRIQRSNFQKRIAVAKLELASLQSVLAKAETQSLVHQILADEPYWEDVLKELSNLIPKEVYLTELEMKHQRVSLKGVAVSRNSERVLSDFTLNLEKGIFKNVKLITSRQTADQSAGEFELECWVD